VLSKVLSLKMAAATTLASLLLAGVAVAATGNLPEPAQRVAHRLGAPSAHSSATTHDANSHASEAASTRGTGAHSPTGPDATGPAKQGLCQAWMSGEGGENGKKDDSTAFKALAAAAGGADKVADFCKDVTPGESHAQSSPSSTTPERGDSGDHSQGSGTGGAPTPGSGADNGQGQGAPPTSLPGPSN
jgi:hypothetical protein